MVLEEKNLEVQKCDKCIGYSSGKAFFKGSLEAKILIVGEAAGKKEVEYAKPFMGLSGKSLQKWIDEHELNVAITNVCMCRPPKNKPTPEMEKNCRPYLEWVVKAVSPRVIFPFGSTAFKAILGERPIPNRYVSKQCYKFYKENVFGVDALVYPIPHPRYFISTGKGTEGKRIPKLDESVIRIIKEVEEKT